MRHLRLLLASALIVAQPACTDPDDTSTAPNSDLLDGETGGTDTNDAGAEDGSADALNLPSEQPLATPWVRVVDGRLVDEWGRELLLRGINARVEGLFDVTFDDGRIPLQPIPDFDASDASRAVELGFNFLRLPINWSGIEPVEGTFDDAYMARMQEVVDLATDAGLYVLLDFHQDAYSKEIGEDGAPLWAIEPAPEQLLQGPLTDLAQRRLSAQVQAAFTSFFQNRLSLQERFMPTFELVVTRFADDSGVIGIEVMNEPVANDDEALYAFYELAVARMRAIDEQHAVWLEPDTIRNFTLASPVRDAPFPDDNIVYCPHMYPNIGGILRDTVEQWENELTDTYDALQTEAASWGNAAIVVGEWGIDPRATQAPSYMEAIDRLSDARAIGHAFWLWKERSQGSWGFFEYDEESDSWTERTDTVAAFVRNAALAVPGRMTRHQSDRASGQLRVEFTSTGQEIGPPLLYLRAGTWRVTLDDSAATLIEVQGTGERVELPWTPQAGAHALVVESD